MYKRLIILIMKIHSVTLTFPKFETYELGSQLRRSSNSVAANLAEGFGNKHRMIYTECISRRQGELRETKHHLLIASRKHYISSEVFSRLYEELEVCSKMLFRLEESIYSRWNQ